MSYDIPDCYDPVEQEARRDRAYAKKLMHRPQCEGCGCPITDETYIDLEPFGIHGYACEQCIRLNTHYTENLEDDYE